MSEATTIQSIDLIDKIGELQQQVEEIGRETPKLRSEIAHLQDQIASIFFRLRSLESLSEKNLTSRNSQSVHSRQPSLRNNVFRCAKIGALAVGIFAFGFMVITEPKGTPLPFVLASGLGGATTGSISGSVIGSIIGLIESRLNLHKKDLQA